MYDHGVEKAPDEVQDSQWDLMASSGVETVRTVFELGGGAAGRPRDPDRASSAPTASCAGPRCGTSTCSRWSSTRPRWARAYRNRFTSPPKKRSDYVTYLAALVERYGPEGTFWAENPELPKRPCASGRSGTSRTCPPTGTRRRTGPYGYARNYPLLLRASYNIVKSLDPGAKIVMAGLTQRAWEEIEVLYQHGIKNYFDVAALQIFPQTVKRAVKATAFFRDAMRAAQGRAQADLPDGDHLARLEGPHRGDQVPAPGDAAGHGHQAEPDVPRDGAEAPLARGRQGVLVHVVVPYGRGGSIFNYAGLQRFDDRIFEPQPALRAYQRSARSYQGCQKTVTGVCE